MIQEKWFLKFPYQLTGDLSACNDFGGTLKVVPLELALNVVKELQCDCKAVHMLVQGGKVSELLIRHLHQSYFLADGLKISDRVHCGRPWIAAFEKNQKT